jgi:hypothetical protein
MVLLSRKDVLIFILTGIENPLGVGVLNSLQ